MDSANIPYCGGCCFFENEDANGIGYCKLRCDSMRCGGQCELDYGKIGTTSLLRGLHYLQKWRRGAKVAMPHPYVVGKLIDAAIRKLRLYGL